ncbi:uncharacterized protein LOC110694003 [Chenopodium quinoa]|uniref:uncharacterized protein LOC110694003 n=1 Tax=Chenopodium quinoa TaxID=63459 RepID=UPI000B776EF2|nr:uncharacterized protein LOC110694003 [Chenopodium quinoa]
MDQSEGETESDSSASTSESSDDLPPLPDNEEEERKKWKEALNMLQSEKTPKRSFATIRKDLAEKAAAKLRAKASKIQQLELDLKAADQQATDAETAKKGAEEAQKKADESAKQADEALKKAQADLGKLKTKVERLEKDAAQAQKNFAATLEAEQNRLVAESDADNDARMKIAWDALYPDADYSIWAMAHSYAENVVYLREQGEPEPASFKAWLSNNEPTAP